MVAAENPAAGTAEVSSSNWSLIPAGSKKLAGGEAQRNHRNPPPKTTSAPAGREKAGRFRIILPRRCRLPENPHASRAPPGRWAMRCGCSGGSTALHHRLISFVPPAREAFRSRRFGELTFAGHRWRYCPLDIPMEENGVCARPRPATLSNPNGIVSSSPGLRGTSYPG